MPQSSPDRINDAVNDPDGSIFLPPIESEEARSRLELAAWLGRIPFAHLTHEQLDMVSATLDARRHWHLTPDTIDNV